MKRWMRRRSKAIAGFAGSTLTAIGTAMLDGNLTHAEILTALGAGLVVGGGLVYAAPRNVAP